MVSLNAVREANQPRLQQSGSGRKKGRREYDDNWCQQVSFPPLFTCFCLSMYVYVSISVSLFLYSAHFSFYTFLQWLNMIIHIWKYINNNNNNNDDDNSNHSNTPKRFSSGRKRYCDGNVFLSLKVSSSYSESCHKKEPRKLKGRKLSLSLSLSPP